MTDTQAASSSDKGTAGDGDGLAKAFEAALGSVELEETDFQAKAKMAAPAEDTEPVDTEADEPADSTDADPDAAPAASEGKATPAVPDVAPPANWDEQRKAAFAKLSPDARSLVLEMSKGIEADYTRRSTELANETRFAQGVRQLITDEHRQQLRGAGLDEISGIRRLIQLNDFATRDGPGYARWVVQQMGVHPSQIFPELANANGDGQPPAATPQAHTADPIQQQVYGALQSLHGRMDQIEQERRAGELRAAAQAIERFRSTTDDAGAPRYRHLPKVEKAMVKLLGTPDFQSIEDMGQRLQRAYETAIALDPDIRSEDFNAEVQKRLADQRKADDVAKARKAKAPIRAAPTGPVRAKPKTLDDTLRQTMSDLAV